MKLTKLIGVFLSVILVFSLTSCCDSLVSTEVKEVDAYVTDVYSYRGLDYVTVEYDGAQNTWDNSSVYNLYKDRIGGTVKCYIITRTYESGKITKKLVYNKDLING